MLLTMYVGHWGGSLYGASTQVPLWATVCGQMASVSAGEENAHLRTVWYVRGCAGREGVYAYENGSQLVSHQDGAGGLP